eukprot:CAMPEP_0179439140 /NCGR_PEP_ID=MMETSP0799-20121207/22781_1 /TAXON_ID=46947 /ORGANISM="Geminigera cryophila, Strain CCMP2564" /LENGTH=391 /DNA_ID=CAMNT_0021221275 /DNA_START=96 /DNA_END=1268 /DNA_ORIENTATION=+
MGDHIICAGLVHKLAGDYKVLFVVVHAPYLGSFNRLFRDLENVKPFVVQNEDEMMGDRKDALWQSSDIQMVRVGYHKDAVSRTDTTDAAIRRGISFAQVFYRHAGVPYSERWAYPIVPRDSDKEHALFLAAKLTAGAYAFVHDDPSRGLYVDRSSVPENMSIYHPSEGERLSNVLFDYSLVLENAAELHLMDSAFALLADALDLSRENAKFNPDGTYVVKNHNRLYRQNWELLFVPEGVTHMAFAIDHPADGEEIVLGTPSPQEYGAAVHQRITISFLDLAPLPPDTQFVLFLDGLQLYEFTMANKPDVPYIPGSCPFLCGRMDCCNLGAPLSGSFGRCELDYHVGSLEAGRHVAELRVVAPGTRHAMLKAFSTFEIVTPPTPDGHLSDPP